MTVLITGASSGLGFEFARIFAREGFDLILVARRSDRLESLKQSIQSTHAVDVQIVMQDLSVDGAATRVFETVGDRPIDILVNNAGIGDVGSLANADPHKLDQLLHLNILTLTSLTRLLLPAMIARGNGRILNVASVAAFMPGPYMAAYYASKAYVLSLSEALADELKQSGVTVTALCPGATSTEFDIAAGTSWGDAYHRSIPTAKEVSEFGYNALMRATPVAIYGWKNRLLISLIRFIPKKVILTFTRRWNQE